MSYDGKILRRAMARFDEDKQRRNEMQRSRERAIYAKCPRIEEITQELSHTMAKIIASGFRRGSDPRSAIAALQEENLSLQRERAELLQKMGFPGDYLEQKPNCVKCGDSGFCGGEMCSCLRDYYARAQNEELSRLLDLGTQSFETFDFDFYSPIPDFELGVSPRAHMERVFDTCRDYAYEFSEKSGSLLLYGDTGLGKTFLSASIARVVSNGGHSVVYDTANHLFSRFEAQKFRREEGDEAENDVERILGCDLLIMDDLGTELSTAFVQSAFYEIINSRLMQGKKTIISTNLAPDELGKRYGAAAASRIEGEYTILPFFGEDIRKLRKNNI